MIIPTGSFPPLPDATALVLPFFVGEPIDGSFGLLLGKVKGGGAMYPGMGGRPRLTAV